MSVIRLTLVSILLPSLMLSSGCTTSPAEPAVWQDIPIMPGAVEIASETGFYEYEIGAPLPEIHRFYVEQLEEAGWTYLGLGEGVGGVFLVHSRDSLHLEISAYTAIDLESTRVVISLR